MNILAEGIEPIRADVVFTHGLRGDAIDTWTVDGVCWPRDLLPHIVKEARILSWSYDSSIANISTFSSQNSIFAHAENLLWDLANIRETQSQSTRPIVFVGHSLGGLVIKEALCRSQTLLSTRQNIELGSIYSHTVGVVFIGTPHRGSFEENFAKIVSWAAWATLRSPNHQLLSTLAEDSNILERQRLTFVSISEKMQIVCLHEEQPMAIPGTWRRVSRLIVPQASACYDGFYVQNGSINGDHNSMCKFSDSSNVGYIRVSGHIKRLIRKAVEAAAAREKARKAQERKVEDAILQALFFRAISHRKDDISPPFARTFEWILRKTSAPEWLESGLSEWLSSGKDRLYCISGKAGSGKSTMMKMLCNSEEVRTQLGLWAGDKTIVTASYFFHNRGTPLQKTRMGMLRGLLHEILSCCRLLMPVVFPDIWERLCKVQNLTAEQIKIEDGFTLAEISKAFLLLVQQEQVPVSVCCFIDGLDEHEGGDRDILEILMELCYANSPDSQLKSTCAFKMCVSARPQNAFELMFERCPGIRIHEHTERDIALYTYGRLQAATPTTFPSTQGGSQELWKIADKIVQESSGIFLWVRLAVESLLDGLENKDFAHQLWERARLLPKDLKEFYKQMIRRIPDLYRQEAFRIFKIVLDSPQHFKQIRMLCYTTVEVATIAKDRGKYLGETWKEEAAQMVTRLKSVCGGLLEVVEDGDDPDLALVQFIHQTAKDYIQDPSFSWDLLVGTSDMAFNFDLFFLEFQLCLYQKEAFVLDSPEEESDHLSLYIARAEKTTGTDQIHAIKRWQSMFDEDAELERNIHYNEVVKLALLDDFTALAVNQGIHSWLRYQVESAGFDANSPTKLGLPLLYYATEHSVPADYELFDEYNGWAWNKPRIGSPNAEMVRLLLRYQKMQGGRGVNYAPAMLDNRAPILELHLSPVEYRWMTCSPWRAFLATLADDDWVRFCGSTYVPLESLADEYLKILELFLQYDADPREFRMKSTPARSEKLDRILLNYQAPPGGPTTPKLMRLDEILSRFEEVKRNKAEDFKRILETYGIDSRTGRQHAAFSLDDNIDVIELD